jgi:CHAD domain-containing protein
MRVATRRLRAALRLFSDVLPPQARSLSAELKWIAGQLGTVRDLDVQIQRLRENAVELGLTDALIPYAAWLQDQRSPAQAELVEALTSQRYNDLTDRLRGTSAWVCDPTSDHPLLEDAPGRIQQAMKKVRKRADAIDKRSSTADLHAVRIRAKRLRYTVEFYVAVYGKPAGRFVRGVVELQDVLGNLGGSGSDAAARVAARYSAAPRLSRCVSGHPRPALAATSASDVIRAGHGLDDRLDDLAQGFEHLGDRPTSVDRGERMLGGQPSELVEHACLMLDEVLVHVRNRQIVLT